MASGSPVAIVTGAAQGLGFAITEQLLQEGYKVCLAEVNEAKGRESLVELQGKHGADKVIFMECDVTSENSFKAVFGKIQKKFGKIDLLVNNAGVADEYDPERVVSINLMGTIIGCKLALEFMGTSKGGKGGFVINVASNQGLLKSPLSPVYCATKHGVVGLTRSYGDQYHLDKTGIMFMAICPHAIQTPLLHTAKMLEPVRELITVGIMEPEYVAKGVTKLLHDKRNGSTLLVVPDQMVYIGIPQELEDMKLL